MAGIAFRLQKLLTGDSYSDIIKAYFYSGIISSGPFLVIIFTLTAMKIALQVRLSIEDSNLLLSLIVYVFAFSMLGVSPFYYIVTRYLADKYYLKQIEAFTSSYLSVLSLVFFIQAITAIPYLNYLELTIQTKWVLFCLYLFISGIWIAMIYLSAAKSYMWIVGAFFGGGIVGTALALTLGFKFGFNGFLNGFTIGQAVTFLILTLRILKEFGFTSSYNFDFFHYFKKYPYLVLVGITYYLGIWIDKLIYWNSSVGDEVIKGIRIFMNYDTPMFLAFITVIPSMAFFLVQMETSFVKHYHRYYSTIRNRDSLLQIRAARESMITNLSEHFQKYALFQGILSAVIIIFIYKIADAFNLNPYQMGIFRIGILGAFLQMGFLMILNIIFYFDFQKDAFKVCLIFLLTNGLLTLVTLFIGYQSFGFGYTVASFITVFFSFLLLNHKLKNLDYWTFMAQPIIIPKFKFELENSPQKKSIKHLKNISAILK